MLSFAMEIRLAIAFGGGFTFILALAAGLIRPWRGLFFLWALGVFYGSTGLVPGLTAPYVALATILGAILLTAAERLAKWGQQRYQQVVVTGGQLLLGSIGALLLTGIFLGPLWGLATGGTLGGLGTAYLYRQNWLPGLTAGTLIYGLRLTALLLPAAILNGRLLGLF